MTELTTQEILQDLLNCEKHVLTMYKQFAIEASNKALKQLLIENMQQAFNFQYQVFELMSQRDLYPTEEAETKKINSSIKTLKENSIDYDDTF